MTDRELLELAAKSAGIKGPYVEDSIDDFGNTWGIKYDPNGIWNPLTDDGDALRLAVALSLHVHVMRRSIMVEQRVLGDDVMEIKGNDPYAATRRAIVRAAAEIGRAQPPAMTGRDYEPT